MGATELKAALNDCLINFDRRVLLTDLLNEYELPYAEVHKTLDEFLQQQEQQQGTKYEKRFLVHGHRDDENGTEVYTVVDGEKKLKDWLTKLKHAESSLYSVELAGGAKAPAEDFKPVRWCAIRLKDQKMRDNKTQWQQQEVKKESGTAEVAKKTHVPSASTSVPAVKKTIEIATKSNEPQTSNKEEKKPTPEQKKPTPEQKKPTPEQKKPIPEQKKPTPEQKKPTPEQKKNTPDQKKSSSDTKKVTPERKKTAASKPTNQKGIGNFFAPASKATQAASENKNKSKSPQKMQDFFKKQPEKPTPKKEAVEAIKVNTSVQLFSDDDEKAAVQVDSSSEEEQVDAIRRQTEAEEETAAGSSSSFKRRRIVDSDEECDDGAPQQKHEKKELEKVKKEEETAAVDAPKSETYLDDDGFVITIKSKKSNTKPSKTKSPPKTSEEKPKATKQPVAKTKQGNIMSFFSKK